MKRLSSGSPPRGPRARSLPRRTARFRPVLAALEGRALLSTLDVAPGHTPTTNDPNDYGSITAAVAAARPGDTIRVAPGVYAESVVVNKDDLKIIGGSPSDADDPQSGPSVVKPLSGFGFSVQANGVTIQDFTIEGGNQTATTGVRLGRAYSGTRVLGNVIEHNTYGLDLATNGAKATVIAGNRFLSNDAPGAAQGNGIYSDQGARNVVISGNFFTGQTNASIILVGGPGAGTSQSYIGIFENRIVDDATVILANTTHSAFSNNTSIRSDGSGILLGGGDSDIAITGNTLRDGAFYGVDSEFIPADAPGGGYNVLTTNRDILVQKNRISGFGYDGIGLFGGTSSSSVLNNTANGNGYDGIGLGENAHGNTIRGNTADRNGNDGIRLGSTTHDNLIQKNSMHGNVVFDAEDESKGSKTAGTANTWVRNSCDTANPPGLCDDHGNGDGGGGDGGNDGHGEGDSGDGNGGKGKGGKRHRD